MNFNINGQYSFRSLCYGFLDFPDEESAHRVLHRYNGKLIPNTSVSGSNKLPLSVWIGFGFKFLSYTLLKFAFVFFLSFEIAAKVAVITRMRPFSLKMDWL